MERWVQGLRSRILWGRIDSGGVISDLRISEDPCWGDFRMRCLSLIMHDEGMTGRPIIRAGHVASPLILSSPAYHKHTSINKPRHHKFLSVLLRKPDEWLNGCEGAAKEAEETHTYRIQSLTLDTIKFNIEDVLFLLAEQPSRCQTRIRKILDGLWRVPLLKSMFNQLPALFHSRTMFSLARKQIQTKLWVAAWLNSATTHILTRRMAVVATSLRRSHLQLNMCAPEEWLGTDPLITYDQLQSSSLPIVFLTLPLNLTVGSFIIQVLVFSLKYS